MGEAEQSGVGDAPELVDQGGVEIGVVVTVDVGPDRGVAVEIGAPLGIG